ncbi:MAG TPA: hypothetical protein VFJ19_16285 [Nocardioidaceae bacterium]|nr:hypothetical protein [Nocardioidaceae bacterium]
MSGGVQAGIRTKSGDELLSDLIASDLGNNSDRALARRVAEVRVRQQLVESSHALDSDDAAVDTGKDEEET